MSKKVTKDPAAPKRNKSAYLLYQTAMRDTFKRQNPGMSFGQLAKYTSAMYAEMPPEEKSKWDKCAEKDKARYQRELDSYIPAPGFDIRGNAIPGYVPPRLRTSKGGKSARDPQAPKKNMSAYLLYQNAMRQTFRTANPDMTFGQLATYTSSMYKSLTQEEKGRWQEAERRDRARYEAEMDRYVSPPGFDQLGQLIDPSALRRIKKRRDPAAPKRARGAYVFFLVEARPALLRASPDISFIDVGHVLGARWRALSAGDRRKYEDLAAEDKRRYSVEAAAYEAARAEERERGRERVREREREHEHPDVYV